MAATRKSETSEAHLAAAYARERHEPRFAVRIAVEISGVDRNGNPFHHRTCTRDVSTWGCCFPLAMELKPNDIFSLRVIEESHNATSERRSLFQVLRAKWEGKSWLIAAWKLEDRDLWSTVFRMAAPDPANRNARKSAPIQKRVRARKGGRQ